MLLYTFFRIYFKNQLAVSTYAIISFYNTGVEIFYNSFLQIATMITIMLIIAKLQRKLNYERN